MKPRVLICVLCGKERQFWLAPGLCERLLEAQKAGASVEFVYQKTPVMAARNHACERALATGADFLVMCDADTVPPEAFVPRVLSEIQERADISIAALPTWMDSELGVTLNIAPEAPTKEDQPWISTDRLQLGWKEIYAAGMGCIFIRRTVIESLERPWFRFSERALAAITSGLPSGPDEDFDFCIRAKRYGFRTFADCRYICDHLHTQSFSAIHANKRAAVEAVKSGKFLVVQHSDHGHFGAPLKGFRPEDENTG